MFKNQQKWIALFVVLTFVWLMQVSTMPVAAAGAADQADLARAEHGAGYLEVVSQKAAPAKKKSVLPVILIGVGLVAVTAVLILVVFKTKYEIVGSWTVVWKWTSGSTYGDTVTFTFVGTRESGTVSAYSDSGPYTVDGKKVTWTLTTEDPNFVWTGEFTGKDAMSGTMVYPAQGASGTWTATRLGGAAVSPGETEIQKLKTSWK